MKKVLLAVAVVATLGLASCGVKDVVDSMKTCVCTSVTTEDGESTTTTESYETLLSCSAYESSTEYSGYTIVITCVEK